MILKNALLKVTQIHRFLRGKWNQVIEWVQHKKVLFDEAIKKAKNSFLMPMKRYSWFQTVQYNCMIQKTDQLIKESVLKGRRQWESRGVRKVPICPNFARTAAIEVRFSKNFAAVFNFMYFRFRPSNAKWIGDVLPNRRNATMRSMFFFLLYITPCLLTHQVNLRS